MIALDCIHHPVIERFVKLTQSERLAHAYLFIGPKGVGKKETALAIAKLVNAQTPSVEAIFADTALNHRINEGNHPDIHVVQGGESDGPIKIDQVRDLIGRIQLRAFEAKVKVIIIHDVEHLTTEAANSLLKTLEEPTAHTLIILTTSVPEANLDTIRSRCHPVFFFSQDEQILAQSLENEFKVGHEEAQFLARFSQGALGKAKQFLEDGFFVDKNDYIDQLVLHYNNEDYVKKLLSDKNQTRLALDVVLSFVRDVFLIKVGMDESLVIHVDRIEGLRQLAEKYDISDLENIIRQLVETIKLLKDNFNIKMAMALLKESLWVR